MAKLHDCDKESDWSEAWARLRAVEIKAAMIWGIGTAMAFMIGVFGTVAWGELSDGIKGIDKRVLNTEINAVKTATILERIEKRFDKNGN